MGQHSLSRIDKLGQEGGEEHHELGVQQGAQNPLAVGRTGARGRYREVHHGVRVVRAGLCRAGSPESPCAQKDIASAHRSWEKDALDEESDDGVTKPRYHILPVERVPHSKS